MAAAVAFLTTRCVAEVRLLVFLPLTLSLTKEPAMAASVAVTAVMMALIIFERRPFFFFSAAGFSGFSGIAGLSGIAGFSLSSTSKALSRSTMVSYLPAMRLPRTMSLRCPSLIAPIWLKGKSILARCTTPGAPFSSRKLTSASPVSNSMMASSVLNLGLARKVSAALFTAFWSLGV